jgi:hypothetical protein
MFLKLKFQKYLLRCGHFMTYREYISVGRFYDKLLKDLDKFIVALKGETIAEKYSFMSNS